jgi:two-component system phosphate regulon response regulator PhoB
MTHDTEMPAATRESRVAAGLRPAGSAPRGASYTPAMTSTSGVVLVVDDDPDIRSALRDVLGDNGFLVTEAGTGRRAWELLAQHDPDVILLDLNLPDVSGLDVLIELTRTGTTPVIVLSGRTGEADRVVGLDLGADDYITKPFSARELVARVNAAIRRRRRIDDVSVLSFAGLVIDEHTHDVTVDGHLVDLTAKEFDLLAFMARSPRYVYSRAQLIEHVWGAVGPWQDDNTVAEHIHRIRRKLDPDDRSRWIETVRGVGYRFTPAE